MGSASWEHDRIRHKVAASPMRAHQAWRLSSRAARRGPAQGPAHRAGALTAAAGKRRRRNVKQQIESEKRHSRHVGLSRPRSGFGPACHQPFAIMANGLAYETDQWGIKGG